jgi:glucose dehydrogenase
MVTLDALPSAGGAMDAKRVYIPIQPEQVQALNRATGAKVWWRDIETTWAPLVLNDVLYVVASDEIHALDAETGAQKWRTSFEYPLIAPLASAGDWLIGVFASSARLRTTRPCQTACASSLRSTTAGSSR